VEKIGLKEWLIPQDKFFFELLENQSKLVLKGANSLHDLLTIYKDIGMKRQNIKDLEHDGDEVVHEIQDRLSRTFITPIDREDIDALSCLYDDILDYTYTIANKLYAYGIDEIQPPMITFGEIILKSVIALNKAFSNMRKLDLEKIEKHNIEVHFLENEGDELLNKTVAELFKQKDIIVIIKYKELYEDLEQLTDICEDVSNLLRDIVLKHS
jgi:hypothetical protein|tara:strand:- start:156 stop:791 length:636 start_codon:yes stop_codon:yes gene_type:complete